MTAQEERRAERKAELELIDAAINRLVEELEKNGWELRTLYDGEEYISVKSSNYLEFVQDLDECDLGFRKCIGKTAWVSITRCNAISTDCIYDYTIVRDDESFENIVDRMLDVFSAEEDIREAQ